MTTQTTSSVQVRNTGRGRPTSDKAARARRAVMKHIAGSEVAITTKDVAKKTKLSVKDLLVAALWLEKQGMIVRTGESVKLKGRGRPTVYWTAV